MTFSELKQTVMGIANLTSQEADRRVGQAINQLYKQLTAELGLDPTRFVTRTQAMTLGVATLTVTNIEKIDRVYDTSDNGRRELVPVSITALRRDATGTSQPTRWALQSVTATTVTILTDTVPQTAYTLQADGMATLADLEGEDVPVIAESYHHVLTWAVLSDELLRKEKDKLAGIYKLKSDELLGKLRQHYVDYPAMTRQGEQQAPSAGVSGSSGSGTLGGTSYTQTGLVTFDRDPDAPFAVTPGSAVVDNLDADKLDGLDSLAFVKADGSVPMTGTLSLTGTPPLTVASSALVTNLNADLVDGLHGHEMGLVNVKQYGAVSDGVTNDNAAIVAAIAAGHTRLFLPANTLWTPTANLVPGNVEYWGGNWTTTIIKAASPDTEWITIGPRASLHNMGIWDRYGFDVPQVLNASGSLVNNTRPFRHIENISNEGFISTHWSYMSTFISTGVSGADQQGLVVQGFGGTGDAVFVGAYDETVGMRVWVGHPDTPTSIAKGLFVQCHSQGPGITLQAEATSALPATVGLLTAIPAVDATSIAITPSAATTTDVLLTAGAKTTGQMISMFHATSAFVGNGLIMNFGNAGGSFNGNFLLLENNNVEMFSVNSGGGVNLTSGQITFPAGQNASANANTLDDYEEGTWTPVIGGSGGTSGQTYAFQVGTYIKIGRLVYAFFAAALTAEGTITGNVQIQGLPFTSAGGNGSPCALTFASLATNWVNVMASITPSTTVAAVTGAAAAGVANTTALTAADINNTTDLRGVVMYLAAA